MKKIYALMLAGVMGLLGACCQSLSHREPAYCPPPTSPACERCAPCPKASAGLPAEEGVIFLVTPKVWKENPPHSCAPLMLIGEPRMTTQDFGPVSRVEVAQVFRNDTAQTVDADWRLPVPATAVIMDLKIVIGSRHFRAVVAEAELAAALYTEALQQGKHAVMAQADEAGGLHLRLGRIRAGERVETGLAYAKVRTEKIPAGKGEYAAVFNGERVVFGWDWSIEQLGCGGEIWHRREKCPGAKEENMQAFPVLSALEASDRIGDLLALDRASGRPDHAKEAYEIAREAKIVSPVSSLLMVDAKGGK